MFKLFNHLKHHCWLLIKRWPHLEGNYGKTVGNIWASFPQNYPKVWEKIMAIVSELHVLWTLLKDTKKFVFGEKDFYLKNSSLFHCVILEKIVNSEAWKHTWVFYDRHAISTKMLLLCDKSFIGYLLFDHCRFEAINLSTRNT